MPEVRLIDANALINKMDIMISESLLADTAVHYALIRELVAGQPTIDAEPVRHGRWKGWTTSKFTGKYKDYDEPEYKDYVYYTCSECYRKSAIQELYCPQCGARMDGGADNG